MRAFTSTTMTDVSIAFLMLLLSSSSSTTTPCTAAAAAAAASWPVNSGASSLFQKNEKRRGWRFFFPRRQEENQQRPSIAKKSQASSSSSSSSSSSNTVKVSLDEAVDKTTTSPDDLVQENLAVETPTNVSLKEAEETNALEQEKKEEGETDSLVVTETTCTTTAKKKKDGFAVMDAAVSLSPAAHPLFSLPGLSMALQKLLRRHGDTIKIWSIKGLRIGLGLYVFNMVVAALESILQDEEFLEDSNLFCKPDMVQKVVYPNPKKYASSSPPPKRVMDLATKLVASGLPLTSDTENSVERVLKSLTKKEATMLFDIMYSPPETPNRKEDIMESWNGIAGHANVKEALLDVLALFSSSSSLYNNNSTLYSSSLLGPPKGILLYGPPGCGKSMLLRALAKTARARTLLVSPSTLLNKYVGESNLLVRTLFGLAQKLSPCIIVVEELDGLFRERSVDEHEVEREIKTEFLQLWDGMEANANNNNNVLVVGATNRPFDVDPAVLRRLPVSFMVGLPCVHARYDLIRKLLNGIPFSGISEEEIAELTEYYSGSDLHQVLKTAVTIGPVRDLRKFGGGMSNGDLRPLQRSDVMQSLQQIRPTPMTLQYRQALNQFASQGQSQQQQQQHAETSPGPTFYNMGTLHAHMFSPSSSFMPPRLNHEEDLSPDNNSFWNTDDDDAFEQDYDIQFDDDDDSNDDSDDDDDDDDDTSEFDDFD